MSYRKHATGGVEGVGGWLALGLIAGLLAATPVRANNLSISNVSLEGQNTTDDFILVQFDIRWENSWRVSTGDPNNWDAAWVFIKYRGPGGDWQHATINLTGHTAASGSTIDTASDGTGVFVYRDGDGTGDVGYVGVQLRWNYGEDGLGDNDEVELRVVGIEMVFVPEGAFAAGDGSTTPRANFTLTTINTAIATTTPSGTGSLGGEAGGFPTGQATPNANWPNGFGAFCIMKYEISQGQYAEFLTMLTSTQAGNRFPNQNGNFRHTISGSHPNFVAGVPDRACNFLSWADGVAYADWAGLRPMTELEYEKASRGTRLAVADEYAWGNTSLHNAPYAINNDGMPNAVVDNPVSGTGNASYATTDGSLQGPLRVGIFAASLPTPSRTEAGATHYGVMEMSGNLWERAVTIGHAKGRAFINTDGDGALDANGSANANNWPGDDAAGAGFRGGAWGDPPPTLRVSDRGDAAGTFAFREALLGFRAVRSAP